MKAADTCVKISITHYKSHLIEEVIYYRYKLPVDLVIRWRWYFEYIAALVKTHHPHRRVELYIGPQDLKCGQDYITEKTISLLQHKLGALKKLERTEAVADLFDFGEQDRQEKIEKLQAEIVALQSGNFNYYVPPTYMNKVKQWIIKN